MKKRYDGLYLGVILALTVAWTGQGFASDAGLRSVAAADRSLIDLVLVLDNSGSMKKNDPDFLTREVVVGFLEGFGENARIGMVVFDRDARLSLPLSDLTNLQNRAGFLKQLESVDYTGAYSDSPAAIERAIYELKTAGRDDADHVIIMLTDGIVDTGDRARDIEKARWLKEDLARESAYASIRIFGIAYTDKADFSLIQTLAIKTGGAYYRAYRAEDIQGIFTKIREVIERTMTVAPDAGPDENAGARRPAVAAAVAEKPPAPPAAAAVPEDRAVPPAQVPDPAETVPPKVSRPAAVSETSLPAAAKSGIQPYHMTIILIVILVLLGVIIAFQLMNRKSIPSKAAHAVAGIAEYSGGKPPGMPRAELIDIHNITGKKTLTLASRMMKVGRDESNDLVISKDTVSSLHALIEYRDGFFYLEDQRSKNKTRLNGVEVPPYTPRKLKSGDEISFNKFKFKFILPDTIPVGETVFDLGGKPEASAGAKKPFRIDPDTMPKAMLIDTENITGKKTVDLNLNLITIGRGVHNTVVIDEDSVSGSHATIEYRNGSFYLEDQRSTNKTFLNGEAIDPHQPEKLKSGDEIMFDAYKFIFLLEHQTPAGDTDENW